MASPALHQWARALVAPSYKRRAGADATLGGRQMIQAVGLHEGGYGLATRPAYWAGSNNWGGIQAVKPSDGVCPVGTVLGEDYDSKGDAKYAVCFKVYPTAAAGADALVAQMTAPGRPGVQKALKTGSADEVALAMYQSHYFGGFHPTKGLTGVALEKAQLANVTDYADRIYKGAVIIAAACGEPLKVKRSSVRIGSSVSHPAQQSTKGGESSSSSRGEDSIWSLMLVALPFGVIAALRSRFA